MFTKYSNKAYFPIYFGINVPLVKNSSFDVNQHNKSIITSWESTGTQNERMPFFSHLCILFSIRRQKRLLQSVWRTMNLAQMWLQLQPRFLAAWLAKAQVAKKTEQALPDYTVWLRFAPQGWKTESGSLS